MVTVAVPAMRILLYAQEAILGCYFRMICLQYFLNYVSNITKVYGDVHLGADKISLQNNNHSSNS